MIYCLKRSGTREASCSLIVIGAMQSVSGVQILLLMVFLISLASKSCGFLSPSSSFSLRRLDFPIPRSDVLVAKVAVNHNVDDQRRAGGISVSGYEDVEMVRYNSNCSDADVGLTNLL